jgi:serine/threonine protein kinase
LVTELVDGKTLQLCLEERNGRKFSEQEAKSMLKSLLETLGGVHSRGVAHRDVKPDNVLVSDSSSIVLIDFGYATQFTGFNLNTICGTPSYGMKV